MFILIVALLLLGGGWWGLPLLAGLLGTASVKDKAGALVSIAQLMHSYAITPAEVEAAYRKPAAVEADAARRSSGDIAKTLFLYLGAIFILAGVSTYIGMFWGQMGGVMRVSVTLGVGYSLLVVLIFALHEKKYPQLILPLTLATVFMLTSGWFVLIHEVFPHGDNWRLAVRAVFAVMTLHQGALLRKYERTVLAFTALFFLLTVLCRSALTCSTCRWVSSPLSLAPRYFWLPPRWKKPRTAGLPSRPCCSGCVGLTVACSTALQSPLRLTGRAC